MTKTLTDDQKVLLDEVFQILDELFTVGVNIQEYPEDSKLSRDIGFGVAFGTFIAKRDLMKKYGID